MDNKPGNTPWPPAEAKMGNAQNPLYTAYRICVVVVEEKEKDPSLAAQHKRDLTLFYYSLPKEEKKKIALKPYQAGFFQRLRQYLEIKIHEWESEQITTAFLPNLEKLRKWQKELEERRRGLETAATKAHREVQYLIHRALRARGIQERHSALSAAAQIEESVVARLPSTGPGGVLTPQEIQKAIEEAAPEITAIAKSAGVDLPPQEIQKILEGAAGALATLAREPGRVVAQAETKPPPPPPVSPETSRHYIIPTPIMRNIYTVGAAPRETKTKTKARQETPPPRPAAGWVPSLPFIARIVRTADSVPSGLANAFCQGLGLGPVQEILNKNMGEETPKISGLLLRQEQGKPPQITLLDTTGQPISPLNQTLSGEIFSVLNASWPEKEDVFIWHGPVIFGIPQGPQGMPPGVHDFIYGGVTPEVLENFREQLLAQGFSPASPQILAINVQIKQISDFKESSPGVYRRIFAYHYGGMLNGKLPYSSTFGMPLPSGVSPLPPPLTALVQKIGLKLGTHQEITIAEGAHLIRFVLPDKIIRTVTLGRFETAAALRTFIYEKTLGRVATWFSKTAIGKTLTEAGKKAAVWATTKLGIKLGTSVAAAAMGTIAGLPLGGPVGAIIGMVIGFVIEAGTKIIKKIFDFAKSLVVNLAKEPEKALGLVGGGILALIILPIPIALIIAVPLIFTGSLGLIGGAGLGIGGILGGIGSGIILFSTAMTAPLSLPIGVTIVSIIGGLAIMTFLVVMLAAGAFVSPSLPQSPAGTTVSQPYPFDHPATINPPAGLTFAWPLNIKIACSSNFGWRAIDTAGKIICEYHEGIDIPVPVGTEVYSSADGVVEKVGYVDLYGNYVVVKHGENFYSLYGHLTKFAVSAGDEIKKNSLIGYSGASGQVYGQNGAHLHFAFSDCTVVPTCFDDGHHTPDPCSIINCPANCAFQTRPPGC